MHSPGELAAQARSLIRSVVSRHDAHYGFGSMSSAVYDTAWVSLITKTIAGEKQWLFPQCFQYVLDAQLPDGGWAGTASQVDGILNTGASLLALSRHAREPLQLDGENLRQRIERAVKSLQGQLTAWDVAAASHVGFEIIVPALLTYLSGEGYEFAFEGRDLLLSFQRKKLTGFKPEYLYGSVKSTALHSLEAFVGQIDFDRVAHHKALGSMMASPSSTAAYLMHASTWDDEAEAYLRHVVSVSPDADGGVPSAYPSTYFEYTWIISTLLHAGFSRVDLECPELDTALQVLTQGFQEGGGVIGFAPSLGSDVDDTAKGIIVLSHLGQSSAGQDAAAHMVSTFGGATHFRTYAGERNPSFSANCNALLALLHCAEPSRFAREIGVIVGFLCEEWWGADGGVSDKWNTSHLYPTLLLVEAFTDLLALIDSHKSSALLTADLNARACIALFQACLRTLLQQQEDGSWGGSGEQTAYGLSILAEARKLRLFSDADLAPHMQAAIDAGVRYIEALRDRPDPAELEYLWIEKVSYRSPYVTEAYLLGALRAASCAPSSTGGLGQAVPKKVKGHLKLFQATPLFSSMPEWQLRASQVEAQLFASLLRDQRLKTFPREDMEEDAYFDLIPFTWTACNNKAPHTFASTTLLYEMMVLSFLNYQADEFMEAVAGPAFGGDLAALRGLIEGIFSDGDSAISSHAHTHPKVHAPLLRFVNHVLQHPAVRGADAWDRRNVRRQLRVFLLAHVTQTEDNDRFEGQEDRGTYESATQTFFQWVRTTSADHTSCPYSFAFIACLIAACVSPPGSGSGSGSACFQTTAQKYLAEAACRHLATMCRMYNDYGSIARDEAEQNLNSVNFPEFRTPLTPGRDSNADKEEGGKQARRKKEALFKLAEYERSGLNEALRRLAEEAQVVGVESAARGKLETRKMEIFRMFVDVTDLYGQIYVVRDVASRMKGTNGSHVKGSIGNGLHMNGTNGVKRKSEVVA